MSMPRVVRHINETRVLATLFQTGSMSRADLARALGLTRSTAGNLVSGLVQGGLVLEEQEQPVDHGSRTGRPGQYVRLNPSHAVFLGADIGVGRLTVVALDLTARVVGRASKPFDLGRVDPETVLDRLAALIRSVIAKLPAPGTVQGLGVAVPGLLDHDGNVLRRRSSAGATCRSCGPCARSCQSLRPSQRRTTPTRSRSPSFTVSAALPPPTRFT